MLTTTTPTIATTCSDTGCLAGNLELVGCTTVELSVVTVLSSLELSNADQRYSSIFSNACYCNVRLLSVARCCFYLKDDVCHCHAHLLYILCRYHYLLCVLSVCLKLYVRARCSNCLRYRTLFICSVATMHTIRGVPSNYTVNYTFFVILERRSN